MRNKLKKLWNHFVEGFETGVWNIALIVFGVADDQEVMSLQYMLPEKIGTILMWVGVIGIVLRYFIKIGWIKPFNDVDTENPRSGAAGPNSGDGVPEQETGR